MSQYTVADPSHNDTSLVYTNGTYFPANWDPRYTLFSGIGANPDHRENYTVHKDGVRVPAVNRTGLPTDDFYVNDRDGLGGFVVNGTLPTSADQGVHSLTDVPVYAIGPCQDIFGGTYGNIDVFYKMAECLGLSQPGRNGNGNGQGRNRNSSSRG